MNSSENLFTDKNENLLSTLKEDNLNVVKVARPKRKMSLSPVSSILRPKSIRRRLVTAVPTTKTETN